MARETNLNPIFDSLCSVHCDKIWIPERYFHCMKFQPANQTLVSHWLDPFPILNIKFTILKSVGVILINLIKRLAISLIKIKTWLISSTHLKGTVVSVWRASMYMAVATLLSPPLCLWGSSSFKILFFMEQQKRIEGRWNVFSVKIKFPNNTRNCPS